MKERPILFSGQMVRAILDDTKTQTRRVVRGQVLGDLRPMMLMRGRAWDGSQFQNAEISKGYGDIGDRLWVRETWREGDYGSIFYRADEEWDKEIGWKPSIFMPRTHSRLSLEVAGVRVERVQEISEEDALAEGVIRRPIEGEPDLSLPARDGYQWLWDTLNAKRGFGWDTNPWVWVIEFKRVT